jgi:hypothetical protein
MRGQTCTVPDYIPDSKDTKIVYWTIGGGSQSSYCWKTEPENPDLQLQRQYCRKIERLTAMIDTLTLKIVCTTDCHICSSTFINVS